MNSLSIVPPRCHRDCSEVYILSEMLLSNAQESLSAVTCWVFYCPTVTELGLRKGEKNGLIISYS